MLILLPSDVQGRGNALIISSRVPLKEKPSGGGWGGGRTGCLNPAWMGCFGMGGVAECVWGGGHRTASGSDRDGTGCVCLTLLN